MNEPTATIIVCAQQNFDTIGGLNSIRIEIEDDQVLNILTKYKNVLYRVTNTSCNTISCNHSEQYQTNIYNLQKTK